VAPTPPRLPFDAATLEAIAPFAPPVVSFHFGLPAPPLLERVKGWGATVLASATTLDEALWLEGHGADVIIAQGLEAGDHRGMFLAEDIATQVGTFALVRSIVREVRGNGDFSPLWAGQDTGDCHAIPAAELTRALEDGWNGTNALRRESS
jgi:nitronate monooxygenase